jgi:hypothetical protein
MNQQLDELRLQRLVDGVLTDAERTDFLQSLEGRPEWWREVALAFVEEQVWGETVGSAQPGPEKVLPPRPAGRGASTVTRAARWVSLAACLLIALGLGFGAGQWWPRGTSPQPKPGPARAAAVLNVDDAAPTAETLASEETSLPQQLEIEYGDGPSRQSLTVPVVHESQIGGRVWHDPYAAEFERLNRELASRGYQLEWRTEYLGGNLRGGSQVVVPVRAIALRHRGQ